MLVILKSDFFILVILLSLASIVLKPGSTRGWNRVEFKKK
jgi:hypothetical protein